MERIPPSGIDDAIVDPGYERLRDVFDLQLAAGLHRGAQLVVRQGGRVVFNRAGGYRDAGTSRPVRTDTPFMVYSATKPFVAMCVHKLAEDGIIDLDSPIARYWPRFGSGGKDAITIVQLLTHRGGIPHSRASMVDVVSWLRPEWSARLAERFVLEKEPGGKVYYHMFSAGLVFGELIRLMTGELPARYLTRVFLKPLGMENSFAGLPRSEYGRASRIMTSDPGQKGPAFVFSNPLFRSIFMPAASLNTTAYDMSVFYQMLLDGGEYGGRRYLKTETVARVVTKRYDGQDGDSNRTVRWAEGFHLGGPSIFPDEDIKYMGKDSTERTFGHAGQGGCALAWADPVTDTVFAFTCNTFLDMKRSHGRFQALSDAARQSP